MLDWPLSEVDVEVCCRVDRDEEMGELRHAGDGGREGGLQLPCLGLSQLPQVWNPLHTVAGRTPSNIVVEFKAR